MTSILQTDSWVETEDCDGPRRTRNSPSRENGGILMTEIQDKYITEFELPYRNIERYIKEIGNNWNRLDNKQKSLIKTSFKNMGLVGRIESFGNKEHFGDTTGPTNSTDTGSTPGPIDPNVTNFIKYLSTQPTGNTANFMDTLWNTTPEQTLQLGLTNDQLVSVRDSMYQWSVDNTYVLHTNWRSGLVFFFFILIILILIIVASVGPEPTSNGFGKSLFGRRS
jgi:hypothetical protein